MRSIGHRVRPGLEIREGHDAAGYPGHRGPYESPRPNPRVQANDMIWSESLWWVPALPGPMGCQIGRLTRHET